MVYSWVYHSNHHFPYYFIAILGGICTICRHSYMDPYGGINTYVLAVLKYTRAPDFLPMPKHRKNATKNHPQLGGCTGVFAGMIGSLKQKWLGNPHFHKFAARAAANKTTCFWGVMGLQIHAKAESSVCTSEIGGNQFGGCRQFEGNQYRYIVHFLSFIFWFIVITALFMRFF